MRNKSAKLILASILSFGPALPAAAQEHSDTGTLNTAKAEKAFAAKPLYSPYAGRNFRPVRCPKCKYLMPAQEPCSSNGQRSHGMKKDGAKRALVAVSAASLRVRLLGSRTVRTSARG